MAKTAPDTDNPTEEIVVDQTTTHLAEFTCTPRDGNLKTAEKRAKDAGATEVTVHDDLKAITVKCPMDVRAAVHAAVMPPRSVEQVRKDAEKAKAASKPAGS